jgi:hypothetical protein
MASNHLAMLWCHHADIIKPNKGIRVTYSTPPTKDLVKSKTMAVIAMMKG